MASSDTAQISTIVDLIQIINPKSMVDIGCGYGKYGFLSKEYLMGDTWDTQRTIVNAVEGYEKNITDVQRKIYNEVFICDAMDFDSYLKRDYDLICMIDAFEHLSVSDGKKFISEILKTCNYLLISVPRYVDIQKGYTDDPNKFEEHRAFWTRSMFKSIGNCLIIPNNARKTIALFSKSGIFKPEIKKFCSKKLYLKFLPYIAADTVNHIKWFFKRNNKDAYLQKSKLES